MAQPDLPTELGEARTALLRALSHIQSALTLTRPDSSSLIQPPGEVPTPDITPIPRTNISVLRNPDDLPQFGEGVEVRLRVGGLVIRGLPALFGVRGSLSTPLNNCTLDDLTVCPIDGNAIEHLGGTGNTIRRCILISRDYCFWNHLFPIDNLTVSHTAMFGGEDEHLCRIHGIANSLFNHITARTVPRESTGLHGDILRLYDAHNTSVNRLVGEGGSLRFGGSWGPSTDSGGSNLKVTDLSLLHRGVVAPLIATNINGFHARGFIRSTTVNNVATVTGCTNVDIDVMFQGKGDSEPKRVTIDSNT